MYIGTVGSPLPYPVSMNLFEQELGVFTNAYLNRNVQFDHTNNSLTLPWQLLTSRHLFGSTFREILQFIENNLPSRKKKDFIEFIKNAKGQTLQLEFVQVMVQSNRKQETNVKTHSIPSF